jgi:hypothetical protein
MSVRLATEKDIPALDKMLANMGQSWSLELVKDLFAPQWITVVHEDKEVDGFYVLQCHYDEKPPWGLLGPGDGPHESHDAWLRVICEMGLLIEDEVLRRYPKVPIDDCYTITRIWTTMGPLRDTIDTKFAFTETTDPSKDGITKQGNCNTYKYQRRYVFEQAKAVLDSLKVAL